jgi:hypothetical protein
LNQSDTTQLLGWILSQNSPLFFCH